MHYRVDHFLPKAFEAIKRVHVPDAKGHKVTFLQEDDTIAKGTIAKDTIAKDTIAKEYKGYISSLGANIVQAGVKAAITFYEAEEKGSKKDRRLINAAIKYILSEKELQKEGFSDYKLTQLLTGDLQQKAMEIMDAAIALKLALRTYKMT